MCKTFLQSFFFLTISFGLQAQVYNVDSIFFPSDTVLDNYLAAQEMGPASLKGFMQTAAKGEFAGRRVRIERSKDMASLEPVGGKGGVMKLERVAEHLYRDESEKRWQELDYRNDRLVYRFGRYRKWKETEPQNEIYEQLRSKYGKKYPAQPMSLFLVESTGPALAYEKMLEVTEVDLQVDEKVNEFGREHVSMYSGYSSSYSDLMKKQYQDMLYDLEVQGSRIKVNAKGAGSSLNFSGKLQKAGEKVYRVEMMNSFYEFHLEEPLSESFKVKKIVHANFIPPKEEYKDIPAYQELVEKYGEKIPYNKVVMAVEAASDVAPPAAEQEMTEGE